MKKLFDQNNPIIMFLARLVDAVVLHFLWLLCCIPVVTIGPATVALYYVLMKAVRNEGTRYYRMYFTAFKENFKKALPLGLVFLLVAGLLVGAGFLYRGLSEATGSGFLYIMIYVSAALVLVWLLVFEYAFPLMARFENTVFKTITNAFFLMVGNFLWTLVMAAVFVAWYALIFLLFRFFFPLIILGYGFVALINSYILNRVFKPYVDKYMEEEEEKKRAAEEELKKRGLMTTVELEAKAERDEAIQKAGIWPPVGMAVLPEQKDTEAAETKTEE